MIQMKLICCWVLVVLAAAAGWGRAAEPVECVPNGGFQDVGEDRRVLVWPSPSAGVSYETLGGNRVMRLSSPQRLEWDAPGKMIWNAEYVFSARVKAENAQNSRLCLWARLPDQHEPPDGPHFTPFWKGSFDWKTVQFRFRMPEGVTRFALFIDTPKDGGVSWLDDVSLTPVDDRPLEVGRDLPSFGMTRQVREQLAWIWSEPGFAWSNPRMNKDVISPVPHAEVAFRRTIVCPAEMGEAQAVFTGDDYAVLKVNGREITRNQTVQDIARVPLSAHLKAGENQVEFVVSNDAGPAGLLARIEWRTAAGKTMLTTNEQWECSADGGKTWKFASVVATPAPAPTQYHWVYPHLAKLSYALSYDLPQDVSGVRMALRATGSLRVDADGKEVLGAVSSGREVKADLTAKLTGAKKLTVAFEDICQPPGGQAVVELRRGGAWQRLTLADFRTEGGARPSPTPLFYSEKTWPINVGAFEAAASRPTPDLRGRLEPWAQVLLAGSTRLFQLGVDDNSSAEFGEMGGGEAVVKAPLASGRQFPRGLEGKIQPRVTVAFELAAVPQHGAALVLDVEDSDAIVTEVGIFANGIFCGNPQILGYDQVPGRRLTNRAWIVTIPSQRLQVGQNTLMLQIQPSLYRQGAEGPENQAEEYIRMFNLGERKDNPYPTSSWVQWDTIYLAALAKPADEPINGRPVWLGTNMGYTHLRGVEVWDAFVVRDMSYLGMEEAGSPVRLGMSIDQQYRAMTATAARLPEGVSVGDHMLASMKERGMRPYVILDAGKETKEPSEYPASHDVRVVKRFGKYFDMLEIGNEIDSPYYGWDAQRLGSAYALIQRQAVAGQMLKQWAPPGFQIMGEGWYHAWDFSVIDAQARRESEQDPGWTDALSAHDYGNSYIIPATTYYLLYGVNAPKPIWVTECGAYTKDDQDIHAFDLNLRGNIAFATYVVQYLLHPYSKEMERFALFSAQKGDAQVLEKARAYRRLLHAYGMHGRPLPWRHSDTTAMVNRPVLVNPVETKNAFKISVVNFSNEAQAVDVVVTMPTAGEFEAIRYGDGATVAEGTQSVRIVAKPDLRLSEKLAAGETIEYLIRKPGVKAVVAATPAIVPAVLAEKAPYRWQSVAIGGGGYVLDVYTHPLEKDLVYIRTDVGGFYRWDATADRWIPLTDAFPRSQSQYYGGEAMALDPSDPNVVYIAAGKYIASWAGKGSLFKSTDRGATWTKLNLDLPMGGNEDKRWSGQRLAVARSNPRVILFGSRTAGLFRSEDSGATWQSIAVTAKPTAGVGIISIDFDATLANTVYAAAHGAGIYRSEDLGVTWSELPGGPKDVLRLVAAGRGEFYASAESGAFRYTGGKFEAIMPASLKGGSAALSVNSRDVNDVLLGGKGDKKTPLFRSRDGGKTWMSLTLQANNTVPWQSDHFFNSHTSSLVFDAVSPSRAWLADWYGVWSTDDIAADPVRWTNHEKGHEEVVLFSLAAPPQGAALLSGVADVDGFVHDRGLDQFPSQTFSAFGKTAMWLQDSYSIAWCAEQPINLVRGGGNRWNKQWAVQTSADGGKTWKATSSLKSPPLRVAMSATNPANFVIVCGGAEPVYTTDGGASFKPVKGLPSGPSSTWYWGQPLAADGKEGGVFYYLSGGLLYRSSDGGANFVVSNSHLPEGGSSQVHTAAGVAGEVWTSHGEAGLYRSTDGGRTSSRIAGVKSVYLFDVGGPISGSSQATVYVYGALAGIGEGIYRSTDAGNTWRSIGDPLVTIGNEPNTMAASQQYPGELFIGTNGRGIFHGRPK